MERHGRAGVVGLFWDGELARGELRLDGDPAHHARVRRLERGDSVRVADGRGRLAYGEVLALGKTSLTVDVARVEEAPRPTALEVVVPVADRDRMLLAAEKCVELGITAWRPAYFARSRGVSPRGEGPKFLEKLRARMESALEQCGGAWLPTIHDEAEVSNLWDFPDATMGRFLLDRDGLALTDVAGNAAAAIAVGPEGGLDAGEQAAATDRGWTLASLAADTLRFETAIIAGVAVVRAKQLQRRRK